MNKEEWEQLKGKIDGKVINVICRNKEKYIGRFLSDKETITTFNNPPKELRIDYTQIAYLGVYNEDMDRETLVGRGGK